LATAVAGVSEARNAYFEQQDLPVGSLPLQHLPTPTFRKIISKGQKLVNEDCSRLNPTKAVNQSQFGL
jgi:hypothetical protein